MKSLSSILGPVLAAITILDSAAAINVDCNHVRADKKSWNLSKLNREHTLVDYSALDEEDREQNRNISRTTFTFNPCQALKREDDQTKKCAGGTFVCGVEDLVDDKAEDTKEGDVYEIAGEYTLNGGSHLDPEWTRLKSSSSQSDRKQHGVRLEIYGQYDKPHKRTRNKAIIDFRCQKRNAREAIKARADDEDDEDDDEGDDDGDDKGKGDEDSDLYKDHKDWLAERTTDDGEGGSITVSSWGEVVKHKKIDYRILQLHWDTPYACEDAFDDDDLQGGSEGGWGFFSWLFFLSFIGILAYFSFFAWINYTRFGKSGFDMLPHADTLRELPQLLSEYAGKIVNTLRGGHASGGYSAL